MKQIILKFLLLFIITFGAVATEPDTILWRSDLKLTWKDFKGTKFSSGSSVASTAYSISLNWFTDNRRDSATVIIKTIFLKNQSWVKLSGKNDYVLAHEQGHLDLAEVYARKFRKALQNKSCSKKNVGIGINNLYDEISTELDRQQNLYDLETRHSIKEKEQGEWLEKINKQLIDLKAFEQHEVKIKLK